ncbi:MAG: cytochrome C oxidase subunit IV family protein [Thermoflexus sp.]|jgi:cytochrome c oxidase subunit 4|nr:cytochrome C oxidase subunit IV family protein [Thermoflexus sp.]
MEAKAHKHPNYVLVGIILILITIAEVSVIGLPVPQLPFLLGFSIAKAFLIVAYFMHLKSDSRLYALLFAYPWPLALLLVGILIWVYFGFRA